MSLEGVVGDFATGTYDVLRVGADTYSADGYRIPGASSTLHVEMCVQPATKGKDTVSIAAGRRLEDMRVIFTETELRSVSTTSAADNVVIDGEPFEVISVDGPWTLDDFTTWRVYVARNKPAGGA